jgi:bifunctional non-homologous end joining protein LigD
MVRADPAHYLATMSRKKRAGKVYIDYLRNGRGATFVAPYSTRRRAGAPVSAPLRWDELTARLRPDRYAVGNLGRRLARLKADPWQGYAATCQEITDEMMRLVGVAARHTGGAA